MFDNPQNPFLKPKPGSVTGKYPKSEGGGTFKPASVGTTVPLPTVIYSNPYATTMVVLPPPPPPPPPVAETQKDGDLNHVIDVLLNAPETIKTAQAAYDAVNRQFEKVLAERSITAFGKRLFEGKEPGQLRAASNDTERKAALDVVLSTDPDLIRLAEERDQALRLLSFDRNRFEGAKIAAQLLAIKAGHN